MWHSRGESRLVSFGFCFSSKTSRLPLKIRTRSMIIQLQNSIRLYEYNKRPMVPKLITLKLCLSKSKKLFFFKFQTILRIDIKNLLIGAQALWTRLMNMQIKGTFFFDLQAITRYLNIFLICELSIATIGLLIYL